MLAMKTRHWSRFFCWTPGSALILLGSLGVSLVPGQVSAGGPGTVIVARPGEATALDLHEATDVVLRANHLLQAERIKRSELSGQMQQALSNGLPSLDVVGNWSRGRDPSFALDSTFGGGSDTFTAIPGADPWFNDFLSQFGSFIPAPGDIPAQTFWRANVNLNWEINPSKVLGAVGAARLGIERQSMALRAVEQRIQEKAVTAYYGIVQAAEKVAAVQARLDDQQELLDTVRLRQELGMATTLDTLQAAVSLANTKPQLSLALAGLRNAGSRLNVLMGRRPEEPLRIVNAVELEFDSIEESVAMELAVGRPDLVVAAKSIDILGRNRQVQKADNRPYLSVSGSYGYVGRTTDTLFDDGHDSWRAAVALNIPVFDGLLTRGLVRETEARIRRSREELSAQRSEAQLEILEILGNLQGARDVLKAVRLNVRRSSEVLDESMLRLKLGKAGFLDVLVAESGVAEARAGLVDARFSVLSQTASLKRALGYSPMTPLIDIPGLVQTGPDSHKGAR